MKLGIKDIPPHGTPEELAEAFAARELTAVAFPVDYTASDKVINAYETAFGRCGIEIAEVGVWCSPFSTDEALARDNRERCVHQLELADALHARCCVNVSGAAGRVWYAYYPENYNDEIYRKNVDFVQFLLDTVKPRNTFYTLEMMQWMLPDSAESYLRFLKDVDRERMAVHLDPVNVVNSMERVQYYPQFMKECIQRLRPHIKSCHLKDFDVIEESITLQIVEKIPGQGIADLKLYAELIDEISPDLPVLLEHLHSWDEYDQAISHVRKL